MKKIFLLAIISLFTVSLFAQKDITVNNKKAVANSTQKVVFPDQAKKINLKFGNQTKDIDVGEPIGLTNYDLQSNSAVAKRLMSFADGSVSATWIQYQGANTSAAERGSGYAHFDGTTWNFVEFTGNKRIGGTVRDGWPAIMSDGTEEFVAAHQSTSNGLLGHKQVIGTAGDTWASSPISGGPEAMLWPRAASSGSHYYVVAVDNYVNAQTEIEAVHFYYSTNSGSTWTYQGKLPGFNSYYLNASGDTYAIDAKDSIVAVVVFADLGDVRLWKSTDYGQNWTVKVINDFPVDAYNSETTLLDVDSNSVADTLVAADQTGDIIIDNNGMVHVVFSRMRYLNETPGAGVSWFPYTDWLLYWNEDMGEGQFSEEFITSENNFDMAVPEAVDTIGWCFDLNGNGELDFVTVAAGEWPFGSYYASLTCQPTMGVDANNNIYVAFSTVMEGDAYTKTDAEPNAQQFRGVWVRARDFNGVWGDPVCISDVDGQNAENTYPTMERDVDEICNLYVQWDNEPGIKWKEGGASAPNVDPWTDNYIIYKSVPVVDILPAHSYVTFNVNMNDAIDSLVFDPATDTLLVTGSFLGWAQPGTDLENQTMTDIDNDGIYSLTYFTYEADTIQYKYFINSGWDGGEWAGDPNRSAIVVLGEDLVINDVWGWKPSVNEFTANVTMTPNPTKGMLNIVADQNFSVTVIDLNGKVVRTAQMSNNSVSIDMTNVQAGLYIVKLNNENGTLIYKVVKQ